MAYKCEADWTRNAVETVTPTPWEVQKRIEDSFRDVKSRAARFKAFADCVDYQSAEMAANTSNESANIRAVLRVSIIEETIRQRSNEVNGYREGYASALNLISEMREALRHEYSRNAGGVRVVDKEIDKAVSAWMCNTKDRVIRSKRHCTLKTGSSIYETVKQ